MNTQVTIMPLIQMDTFEITIVVLVAIILVIFIAVMVLAIIGVANRTCSAPNDSQRLIALTMEFNNLTDLLLRYMGDNKDLCNLPDQMTSSLAHISQQGKLSTENAQVWSGLIESTLQHRELTPEAINTIKAQFSTRLGNAVYNWLHDIVMYGKAVGQNCHITGSYRDAAFNHGAYLAQLL